MASLLEEILGEKEGALPPEPVKPEKTGDFWTDLKNQYNYNDAMTRYNEQAGVAAQRPFSEHMKVAEFRPANKKDKSVFDFLKWYERASMDKIPKSEKSAIRKKVKRNVKEEDLTPQSMRDYYNEEDAYNMISDNTIIDLFGKKGLGRIRGEIEKDLRSVGYPGREELEDWNAINRTLEKPKPEYGIHGTNRKNLESIAEKGLIPPKSGSEPNFHYPEQQDKVFFSEKPSLFGNDFNKSQAVLRTKLGDGFNPDIHQGGRKSGTWWQTKNSVPPEALEIETAPGQWEALLDYIRKGGK